MVITGRQPCLEAKRAEKALKLYVRKGASIHFDNIDIPFEVLPKKEFETRFGLDSQGVACEVSDFEYMPLSMLLKDVENIKGILFLDKILDTHNFGAIIRAAHCFGIRHIIVPKYDQAPVTNATYKASAGSLFYMNIIEVTNLGEAIDELKKKNFFIVASDMDGTSSLKNCRDKVAYPLGVIIGSEGRGIRQSILERADMTVKIEMNAIIDSLNASMSAAIMLYEFF